MTVLEADKPIEDFIDRWSKSSGAERANFPGFAIGLCELLGVDQPTPSVEDASQNPYAFERGVDFKAADGTTSKGRIDLYKKNCFVLEAKQSRLPKGKKAIAGQPDLFVADSRPQGSRSANRAWDTLMINARRQAEDYARALPASDGWPPFILVCDVGHCIEVYADFTGQGKNYAQFPDRNGFRIFMEDLRHEKIRERLRAIWEDPHSLDPTKRSARVTRDISKRLAAVSKALEVRDHNSEDVALFLMRCLFTMFAEDVQLLPENCFTNWLERARKNTEKFKHELAQLWQAMDRGDYATIAEAKVKRFNGSFFHSASMIELEAEEIGELLAAAKADWRDVDPAIFGTLLEQALDKDERRRLGAHYTPRAYVKRMVVVTIMEPLRQEWAQVQATVERLREEKRNKDALQRVRDFHHKLCTTRVLDPACGTGNFLYVALELMKELENEVLDAVVGLGSQEGLVWMDNETVGPKQFLGLELNTRAAAIAELVIWLGYLQLHYRAKTGHPPEPILSDFHNIQQMDAVLTWDNYPVPKIEMKDGKTMEIHPNARRPDWPEAEFIVGNPPFIGGKDIRERLGDSYAKTLWRVNSNVNNSADFVMYWWDRAAEITARKGSPTRRFGFVTTNSITQSFSRRTVARHLDGDNPVSLIMAIPDHPWTKATEDSASVRIAMTVATAGTHKGVLRVVEREDRLNTDEPEIQLRARMGRINADLTIGVDLTDVKTLQANQGLSSRGVALHGKGFIVTPEEAEALGLGKRPGLKKHIRPYRHGRDLTSIPRGVMVIDLFGLMADEVRQRFPEVYQHVLEMVKPAREEQYKKSPTKDAKAYLDLWWVFGKPRENLRPALADLPRYIATVETSKHRFFQFLDGEILPDNKLILIGSEDAYRLGVLSATPHQNWVDAARGQLGPTPVYVKSDCFDPFPFPDCDDDFKEEIRAVAEELDAHRKARQAEHSKLTLTQIYNVLEKIKAGESLDDKDEQIKSDGLVLILKELHETLDALVFEAYGWPVNLGDDAILERLVALNKERVEEEKAGHICWLRPDYQIPRFGDDAEKARLEAEKKEKRALVRQQQAALALEDDLQEMKPKFPTGDELAETAAIMRLLAVAASPLSISDLARSFSQGKAIEKRIALTILALARLGHIASPDGGEGFSLRSVA